MQLTHPLYLRSLLLLVGFFPISELAMGQQRGPSPVVVSPVFEDEVLAEQTFVGTVTPLRMATIGSAVDGRVVELPVEEGDRVEEGQALAQLLTDTITLEIAAAEAELENRRQQLAELRNGTRPEEIAQTHARMEASQARMNYQQARRKRVETLIARSVATEDELEEAIASAIEAEQNYLEAKAAYELAVAGPREELIAQAEAQVALQEATVQRLNDQKQKHTMITRFPGYVVQRHTELGQWVNRGDPVVEVVHIDVVDVVVQVVERSVPFIRTGQTVRVQIPALPQEHFEGTVVSTIPRGDERARTFPVEIRVENREVEDGTMMLKAGMYARALLPVGKKQTVTLVPKDAIVLGGATPTVIVVNQANSQGDTGEAAAVPVELGTSSGDFIQVTGELSPGEMVVVQGNERLRPGQQVVLSRVMPVSDYREVVLPRAAEAEGT